MPAVRTADGIRALSKDRPIAPDSVERYLQAKFGEAYGAARAAMTELASALPPAALAEDAYALYEKFRPEVPAGVRGWGAAGTLRFARIRVLAS